MRVPDCKSNANANVVAGTVHEARLSRDWARVTSPSPLHTTALGEQVEGALYEWREKTASVRVGDDPGERLDAVLAMAGALRDALSANLAEKDMLPAS